MDEELNIVLKTKRARFGSRYKCDTYVMPKNVKCVKKSSHDTILFFHSVGQKATRCIIFGMVDRIVKGKDYDLLFLWTGNTRPTPIIVVQLNARKQLSTCKKNEWATIIGDAITEKTEDNHYANSYMAVAIQGWYLPKMVDIKTDLDTELMTENDMSVGNDILSLFEK